MQNVMQNLTSIGATVAGISVTGCSLKTANLVPSHTNVWWVRTYSSSVWSGILKFQVLISHQTHRQRYSTCVTVSH